MRAVDELLVEFSGQVEGRLRSLLGHSTLTEETALPAIKYLVDRNVGGGVDAALAQMDAEGVDAAAMVQRSSIEATALLFLMWALTGEERG